MAFLLLHYYGFQASCRNIDVYVLNSTPNSSRQMQSGMYKHDLIQSIQKTDNVIAYDSVSDTVANATSLPTLI